MPRKPAATVLDRPTQPVALLRDVDPAELVIGDNVRAAAGLTKEFLASIKERGVLEAVTVYLDDDERFVVVRGQRRTAAAVKVGLAAIPVLVIAKPSRADEL